MRYIRDLRGYGASTPNANWPNGAKIAVQFVLNYECHSCLSTVAFHVYAEQDLQVHYIFL